jgi:hypothetical protein
MSILKVTFATGRFGHAFGHDPELRGIAALADNKPAHLILTLDMADPRLIELGVDVGAKLRLVHPYYFSNGNTFVYHHLSENEVRFLPDAWTDSSSPLPPTFPRATIELVELPAPPRWLGAPGRWPGEPESGLDEENIILNNILLGRDVPVQQSHDEDWCPACESKDVHLIACVPATPAEGLGLVNIWGDEFVCAIFSYCRSCKAVITHNEI